MSLIYQCDFYPNNTTGNSNAYKPEVQVTIKEDAQSVPIEINGVVCEIVMKVELKIPAISDPIHVSGPAWKDTAQLLKDWLDATFP